MIFGLELWSLFGYIWFHFVPLQVFDNHGTHTLVKQILLGNTTCVSQKQLSEIEWFSRLTYKTMTDSVIGNMNFSQAFIDGDAFFCLNGPLHLQKNFCSALRGGGSIYVGDLFVDISGLTELDLPPAPYAGYDSQSDLLAAMLLNPFHYVTKIPDHVGDVRAPGKDFNGDLLIHLFLFDFIFRNRLTVGN